MFIDPTWDLSVLCGSLDVLNEDYCDVPFSPLAIEFCAELSQNLMAATEVRAFPDLVTFAFFCRRANLEKKRKAFTDDAVRIGRGLVLHIAPANIPVNFAYSFVFGLLAGNANLVRVPSRLFPQVDLFCRVVAMLFQQEKYQELQRQNVFLRFNRDSLFLPQASVKFDVMMLWGGDQTLGWMRKLNRHPRCVEVAFPDRYSFAVMDANAVLELDEEDMSRLCNGFYNDTYLVDQNACSSPHLLVWQGDEKTAGIARERFWKALQELLERRYAALAMQTIEKQLRILQYLDRYPLSFHLTAFGPSILVARLDAVEHFNHGLTGLFGLFFETVQPSVAAMLPFVTSKYQTLTYFGVPPSTIQHEVVAARCKGIDRVVPVGDALDMDLVWDGYSLVHTLSRIIAVR